jgi:hypothetical protein
MNKGWVCKGGERFLKSSQGMCGRACGRGPWVDGTRPGTYNSGSVPLIARASMHSNGALMAGYDVPKRSGQRSAGSHTLFVRPQQARSRVRQVSRSYNPMGERPENSTARSTVMTVRALPSRLEASTRLLLRTSSHDVEGLRIRPAAFAQSCAARQRPPWKPWVILAQHAQPFRHSLRISAPKGEQTLD